MAVSDFPTIPDFPYTKLNELNLDWLVDELKALDERVTELEERVTELEGG